MAELEELVRKRGIIKGHFTRVGSFIRDFTSEKAEQIPTRLQKCGDWWNEFENLQFKIEELDKDHVEEQMNERVSFEETYFDCVARLGKLGVSKSNLTSTDVSQKMLNAEVKLPVMEIPTFYGSNMEWCEFFETFNTLVDSNESLTNIQKFYYLKNCLKGSAAEVIRNLEVSSDNYKEAWVLLKERFENKKIITLGYIESLFNFEPITKESYVHLRKFVNEIRKDIRALKTLKVPVEHWDIVLIYILENKLDSYTRREWKRHGSVDKFSTMAEFIKFLENRCQLLETMNTQPKKVIGVNENKIKTEKVHTTLKSFVSANNDLCLICKDSKHALSNCKKFIDLPILSKRQEISKADLCWNCLRRGHRVAKCVSRGCKHCGKKHNSLLHVGQELPKTEALGGSGDTQDAAEVEQPTSCQASTSFNGHNNNIVGQHGNISEILLSTAIVRVADYSGAMHECRALLDSGSQSSFMTKALRDKLQLPVKKTNMSILGIGSGSINISGYVNTTIYSNCTGYSFGSSFLLVDRISDNIPVRAINSEVLKIPDNIKLADSFFGKTGKIDLLLGVTVFWDLLRTEQIKLGINKPILQNTELGWIVSGPVVAVGGNKCNTFSSQVVQSCNLASGLSLQDQLEKFWSIEEYPRERIFSQEEEECERIFNSTTERDDNGRFVVKLPIRSEIQELGNSYCIALKRFHHLERKLSRNHKFKEDYDNFIQEYISSGHMTKIGSEANGDNGAEFSIQGSGICYLPHHGVVKETSLTTKLRVVFDASAATDNGISLNNRLMVGPKLQDDIFSILVRFRKHQVVFAADIEKMYRQVLVHREQRDLQRILWRFSLDQPIEHYRMNTVTYGTASASYLAVRCLQQLGLENALKFPEASQIIIKDFYMDDLLSGCSTVEGAIQLKHEVSQILESGGFVLRKWMSNHKNVVLDDENERGIEHYIAEDNGISKILGLCWNSRQDSLHFKVNLKGYSLSDSKVTKRSILSLVSQVFDPLGLVGPMVVKIKVMLQCLWRLKIGWDEAVPPDILTAWNNFRIQIEHLQRLKIPRQVICAEANDVQIHCFCDASQVGYGGVIYVRSTDLSGNRHVRLLCSKSRVAPLKVISLPRLELCGALLVSRLAKAVIEATEINYSSIHYWCDSSVVLCWLAGEPIQWATFVANRVSEIQTLTDVSKWRHVMSESNPADVISRGMDCDQLQNCNLWWQGPNWLSQDEGRWPQSSYDVVVTVPEQRVTRVFVTNTRCDLFTRYSSLSRLQRVTAYLLRFKVNCKLNKCDRNLGTLTVYELQASMNLLVRLAQSEAFGIEIKALQLSQAIAKTSKLVALNPFLDEKGILRVGGRLGKSDLDYEQRHPVILPNKHQLTKLVIINQHYRLLHAGPQALLAQIRLKYWPLGGRRTIRGILKGCIVCFRARPRDLNHIMGELPRHRVTPSRPFTNVGVDYAGPFDLKVTRLRGCTTIKCYLCIFICFSTRAVHLELVGDLTTEAFLNCFKRFIARRGICENVYSDNATNFVGADRELQHLHQFLLDKGNQNAFAEYFSQLSITWHFIPPRSPHFGGLWESAVKAAKYHITRVVGNHRLTFEEFNTVVTQIESCLNSRPLTPLTEDSEDLNVITPGHFLIGTSLSALPQEDLRDYNPNKLKRYHLMTQMVQSFWSKWSKEYLGQLQQRNKWRSPAEPIKIGAMVIIKDENLPPLKWQLARVVQLHPGSDNTCRVVTVKTAKSVFKRALSQLCELPIDDSND